MIIHSTANISADTCAVRIEGIDPGTRQETVELVARGAAGKHNLGYEIAAHRFAWCDLRGRLLDASQDTSDSTVALVICRVVEP